LQSADLQFYHEPVARVSFYPRFLERPLVEALEDAPAVLIHGPRQSGKTTLAQRVEDLYAVPLRALWEPE